MSFTNYVENNRERFLEEWKELLRIPSISADPKYMPEIEKAAAWCANKLKSIGMENVAICPTKGCPVVYADWLHAGADKPTVMIYGHYDVQPADPINLWQTPAFEPEIRNGKMYARGANDDKGQLMTQLLALEAHMKTNGKLPLNIKVFIEGEEEAGTGATDIWVKENAKKLACDAVTISDTAWHAENTPSICYALRGICYTEVTVKGPNRDLHSGVYGGKIQNPLNAIAKIIAQLQDENGVIQIPGYYDDVVPLTEAERAEFRALGDPDAELKKDLGVNALWGEKGYTTDERNWARPSLDVNGIWGGYANPGAKTVIASEGGFKLSSRIVANQSSEKCFQLIKRHIEKIAPPGVMVEVKLLHGGEPTMVPVNSPFLQAAVRAFEKGFGKKPVLVREGASIPITAVFQKALGVTSIFMGYGLTSDNIHSPNEKFELEHFFKGIVANTALYEEYANVKKG